MEEQRGSRLIKRNISELEEEKWAQGQMVPQIAPPTTSTAPPLPKKEMPQQENTIPAESGFRLLPTPREEEEEEASSTMISQMSPLNIRDLTDDFPGIDGGVVSPKNPWDMWDILNDLPSCEGSILLQPRRSDFEPLDEGWLNSLSVQQAAASNDTECSDERPGKHPAPSDDSEQQREVKRLKRQETNRESASQEIGETAAPTNRTVKEDGVQMSESSNNTSNVMVRERQQLDLNYPSL